MPIVSVIIPYYNVPAADFKKCLDSLLCQTFTDFEIIVINDGSKQEYSESLERICRTNERIKLITQENQGVSVARNVGVKASCGQYCVFIDADDYVSDCFLKEAYDIACSTKADILYSFVPLDYTNFESTSKNKGIPKYTSVEDDWLKKYTVGYLYKKDNFAFGRGPWARFIKTDIAKSVEFIKGVPLGEDVLWNLEILSKASNKILVQTIWYCYVNQEYSVTKKYDEKIEDKIKPFYEHIKMYLDNEDLPYGYYCQRVFRDLKRYPFKSYYGNKENGESFINKWKKFNQLFKVFPWESLQSKKFWKSIRSKDKIKALLVKTRLIYLVWSFESLMQGEK